MLVVRALVGSLSLRAQGKVISQKPAPGSRHSAGTKVKLLVRKGRKPS